MDSPSHRSGELTEEFLAHFGVKGMRWGVRRDGSSTGKRSKSKSDSSESKDSKRSSKLRKKKASEMSNDELKELTRRLQLEKQLRDLTPQTNRYQQGKKVVNEAVWMANTASQVYNFVNSPVGKLLREAVTGR